VRCPWHKWDFDVASGRCVVDPQLRVRRYPVTVSGGQVVVSLDGHG
jgi:nitrite reductase/ring-hydroxylating ferredoxin subunit